MENKENKEISIDTFSTLANIGWALTLLRMAGVINTNWNDVLGYWLCLLAVSVILGLVTALIGWASKGGNNSAE
ncbi:hypothetical protein [Lacticaseibacillus paracasei]|uniref:hypothetical protein n=1 Tax=Lacticaseibacillus paracasei TaxID=1597 RepID=UPI000BC36534|nr:hypothetical protein [Lacticaseibacillus paracasei]ATG98909.1 hypothetical protein FAM18149p_05760 [Lacticaseibacillus paracasei]RND78248.1 hypothetical protein FAM18149_01106 [Lacticaseibacillus paracasei]RND85058.1 hypothetical protein FAM18168_01023 [Lacticaseibacillus paracasei]